MPMMMRATRYGEPASQLHNKSFTPVGLLFFRAGPLGPRSRTRRSTDNISLSRRIPIDRRAPSLAVRDDTHCVRRTHVDGRRRDPTISQLCRIRVGCLLTYSVGPVYYLVNTLLNVVAWQGSSFNTFACWICTLFYVHIYLL